MVFVASAIVVLFGVLIGIVGLWGILRPQSLQAWIQNLTPRIRLTFAALARAIFGVALLVAAGESLFPTALQALGVLALLAAVALLFIGPDRLQSWANWWAERPAIAIRLWCVAAAALSGFLIHAVT